MSPAVDRLDAIIRAAFAAPDDIDFEKGFCGAWASGLMDFLSSARIISFLVIACDHEDIDDLADDEDEPCFYNHAMVWVPDLRMAFDWRGAHAHTRWHQRDPQAAWKRYLPTDPISLEVSDKRRDEVTRRLRLAVIRAGRQQALAA